MIGLGAVGETMIVLMATGNTAIMDMNIFEGMRTLSANIAVEMPESEVGSSHFRIPVSGRVCVVCLYLCRKYLGGICPSAFTQEVQCDLRGV